MSRESLVEVRRVFGLKEIYFSMGMFDFHVRAVIGPEKFLERYARVRNKNPEFSLGPLDKNRGWCLISEGPPIIWIPRAPRTVEDIGALVHECQHAVVHMAKWMSMPITKKTDEVAAHAIEWMVRCILKNCRERKHARNKSKATKKSR